MVDTKKAEAVKPVEKAADKKAEPTAVTPLKPGTVAVVKKEETKPAVKAQVKEPVKEEAVKQETKEPAKRGRKPAAKTADKKTAAKKTAKAPAKKAAAPEKASAEKAVKAKETISIQFSGKSYGTEELVKIAKDVWKYDLNQKAGDFKSVELYVKPEEGLVYYVINGDVTGNFHI